MSSPPLSPRRAALPSPLSRVHPAFSPRGSFAGCWVVVVVLGTRPVPPGRREKGRRRRVPRTGRSGEGAPVGWKALVQRPIAPLPRFPPREPDVVFGGFGRPEGASGAKARGRPGRFPQPRGPQRLRPGAPAAPAPGGLRWGMPLPRGSECRRRVRSPRSTWLGSGGARDPPGTADGGAGPADLGCPRGWASDPAAAGGTPSLPGTSFWRCREVPGWLSGEKARSAPAQTFVVPLDPPRDEILGVGTVSPNAEVLHRLEPSLGVGVGWGKSKRIRIDLGVKAALAPGG